MCCLYPSTTAPMKTLLQPLGNLSPTERTKPGVPRKRYSEKSTHWNKRCRLEPFQIRRRLQRARCRSPRATRGFFDSYCKMIFTNAACSPRATRGLAPADARPCMLSPLIRAGGCHALCPTPLVHIRCCRGREYWHVTWWVHGRTK